MVPLMFQPRRKDHCNALTTDLEIGEVLYILHGTGDWNGSLRTSYVYCMLVVKRSDETHQFRDIGTEFTGGGCSACSGVCVRVCPTV